MRVRLRADAALPGKSWSPRQLDDLNQQRQALLDEARAGSVEAQMALLDSYWREMTVYFGRRLSPKLAAKESECDLVQKAATHAWRGFAKFVGCELAGYHAWLMRICRHVLAELQRRFRSGGKRDLACEQALDEQQLDGGGQRAFCRRQPSPDEIVALLESCGQLQLALEQLPAEQRQIVAWRHYDGLALAAVARLLGASNDSVER